MFEFGIKDIIDIFLVALILYYIYRLMKESRSLNVFIGIMVFVLVWLFVSQGLEMRLLGSILDKLVSVGVIGIIVLFQEEIRHFFYTIGAHQRARRFIHLFRPEKKRGIPGMAHEREDIFPIVMACLNMSKQRVGALIVMQNQLPLTDFIRTGEVLNARISQRLIENIFFKNSPLHDGAMIISGEKITAAGCILPISHDMDIPKEFGLRHRAAKGISKETDALAIVVSEETGNISAAYNDEFRSRLSAEDLELLLMKGKF